MEVVFRRRRDGGTPRREEGRYYLHEVVHRATPPSGAGHDIRTVQEHRDDFHAAKLREALPGVDMHFESLITALLGLFTGAALQHIFTSRLEVSKHLRALRSQSYVDFVNAVAALAAARQSGDMPGEKSAMSSLAQAKARIAMYGAASVVTELAAFYGRYTDLSSVDAVDAFVEVVRTMRSDALGKSQGAARYEIYDILFDERTLEADVARAYGQRVGGPR